MRLTDEVIARLRPERFPRSARYDPGWILANEMGPCALWLLEALCEHMVFQPGMRVLDMGCGRAMTSIFLAREFGVRVWANDLWIPATENWQRVVEAGEQDRVCPIHAEAHALPYAEGFFDAVVSIDSYQYYGTDDCYLKQFVKLVRPGGQIGIVVPSIEHELAAGPPAYLDGWWDPSECYSFHSPAWWRRHWSHTQLVDVDHCEEIADSGTLWLEWLRTVELAGTTRFAFELPGLEADQAGERLLGFTAMVARRRG